MVTLILHANPHHQPPSFFFLSVSQFSGQNQKNNNPKYILLHLHIQLPSIKRAHTVRAQEKKREIKEARQGRGVNEGRR